MYKTKQISRHNDNTLVEHFTIKKKEKLNNRKYYFEKLCFDVKSYIKSYDVCLYFKAVMKKL